MKKAIQQMMLGSICPSKDKTIEVLNKIKESGYEGIELNSYMIHPTSLFVQLLTKLSGMPSGNLGKYDWSDLLKQVKLETFSLHSDLNTLENKYELLLDDARRFNVKYIVITGMYNYPYHITDQVISLAHRLNNCGKRLKQDGLNLLYHNHNIEFVKFDNNITAFDILLENTDKDFLNIELDTYWLIDAGINPVDYMNKIGNRIKLWHIADRGIRLDKKAITPIVRYDSVELGHGNINLDDLFKCANKYNIEWVILETHRNWINNSPLESIILSSNYLNNHIY